MSYNRYSSSSIDTFLGGGEVLALLIRAGADPLAADDFGQLPQDTNSKFTSFPLPSVEKQIFLAFWHQALRICDLLESKYCHCLAHNPEKMPRQDINIRFPGRRRGFHESLSYDTFEEEMSAALRSWDKSVAQRSDSSSFESKIRNVLCDALDEWIQGVLIELQIRQKKASSQKHVNASLSVDGPSDRTENKTFRSDMMRPCDNPNIKVSPFLTHGSDSDETWETNSSSGSSSSSSEEEWESAPET